MTNENTNIRKVWYTQCAGNCARHWILGGKKRRVHADAQLLLLADGWVKAEAGWVCPDCVKVKHAADCEAQP